LWEVLLHCTGFLEEKDYVGVVEHMRLGDGRLWPIPIVLDVSRDHQYHFADQLILCDRYGNPIALLTVTSIYTPDKTKEAQLVYGTKSLDHAGVRYLFEETGDVYIGGPVKRIGAIPQYDFKEYRLTPQDLKERFKREGKTAVVAFQTRNPIHRGHFEVIMRAKNDTGAHVLVHPVVGPTKEGDINYVYRVRGYRRLIEKRMQGFATLALLPIAMRMAGPREALWHALIRKNYGATHFIVGRDHAGMRDSEGNSFYGIEDSQKFAKQFEKEIGITIVPAKEVIYVENENRYMAKAELEPHHTTKNLSGSQFRSMLFKGEPIPEWFAFPEVVEELAKAASKEKRKGAVLFFTGLSGAGKSTIAHTLYHKLLQSYDRSMTILDGDVIRQHLSKGLGFSREDRDINVERIGFVAAEIAKHGGLALCAVIAPYKKVREKNRRLVSKEGTYIEIFVNTPQEICEERDPKGLYKKARAGLLPHFTGVDDPYEIPENPEMTIDASAASPEDAAEEIIQFLASKNII
jgi:sulfate adenylyltransferase